MNQNFTLYVSSGRGQKTNTSYPFPAPINSPEDLAKAAQYDHVCAKFADGKNNRGKQIKAYRSKKTFLSSDCLPMDCDNTSSNPLQGDSTPDQWKTPADVAAAFPNVPFYVVYSRNHMKEKDGKAARPRFHIYFPMEEVNDIRGYEKLKSAVQRFFPAFDDNAIDGARFFFGVEEPKVEYYAGDILITEFIFRATALPASIPSGTRNATLLSYGDKLLKRFGDTDKARDLFLSAADRCEEPMEEDELKRVWENARAFFHNTVEKDPSYELPENYEGIVELLCEKPDFIVYNKKKECSMVDPTKLALHVKTHLPFILVLDSVRDTRTKYVYEDGAYRLCSDERFKGYIKSFIEAYKPEMVHMRDVDEAYRNLSAGLENIPYDLLNANEGIINFQNGLLHLDDMTLHPHTPNILSSIQLNCEWPETPPPTPVFDSYLATLSDFDDEIQTLLLQFMGAVLSNVKGGRYKKALFLSGPGDSGKSQLKILAEKILGRDNFTAIDLPELEGQFGASMIYGKRLTGTADMTFMTIRELKMFKTATGGDHIRMEFKGKTGFSYRYTGLVWFCMNKPPLFGGDNGEWVYNRIMLVQCPNSIDPSKQDHELLDKMYEERDGIVYKAIMALKDTIDAGYRFSEPESVKIARNDYRIENDSIIQFCMECLEPRKVPGRIEKLDYGTVTNVHRIYQKWCNPNNHGYAKTKKEFIEGYCDYFELKKDHAVIRRGKGMYFANHKVTEEALSNLLPSDSQVHRDMMYS